MTSLSTLHCADTSKKINALDRQEITQLLAQLSNWTLTTDDLMITRHFTFDNFYHTMGFVNAVAWIANQENHHPDLAVGYNYCTISYATHSVQGLTKNDFICAAKIDALQNEGI